MRSCIPKPSSRDRRSYHYPPMVACPRCDGVPFDHDDGCSYCGLARLAIPAPAKLDPRCGVVQGWLRGWPNTAPPSAEQVADFIAAHACRCDSCQRFQVSPRRPIRWARFRLRRWAERPTPQTGDPT